MQLNLTHTPQLKGIHVLALTSCLAILFLAFIDEGYYSFAWMADIGNWIAVVLFTGLLFLLQWGVYGLSLRLFKLDDSVVVSTLTSGVTIFFLLPALFILLQSAVRLFLS